MNKYIHSAILYLAKAVLCMVMLFVLIIILLLSLSYPILAIGIILFIAVVLGMTFTQLSYFVGYVMRGNKDA